MKAKDKKSHIRIDPQIKSMAQQAAELDRRTLTSLIEFLLIEHCPKIIANRKGLELGQQSGQAA